MYIKRAPTSLLGLIALWIRSLASFPKGSRAADFRLSTPPDGYSCRLGRFTDHY